MPMGKLVKQVFKKKSHYHTPSIPKPSQAFGYTHDADGRLVLQDAPYDVVEGEGMSTIGSNHSSGGEKLAKYRLAGENS